MQNTNNLLDNTTNHLKSFIKGLKEVSDELSESEFEQYLKADILPGLLEEKTVYGVSIFSKMDLIKTVQIDSILKERGMSIELAISKMNVEAICWLLEHLSSVKGVISDSEAVESHYLDALKDDYSQLQAWINEDVFERIQNYEYELKNKQAGEHHEK